MRKDKQAAIALRLKGKSYSEIQTTLGGVSKSTLSLWLKNVVLSDAARELLATREREKSLAGLIKRNKRQTTIARERKEQIIEQSRSEVNEISRDQLRLIGASLYWAEGYKRPKFRDGKELMNHPVSFTNSDPKLLLMFLRFIKEICEVPVERIKVGVRIFEHLNEEVTLFHLIACLMG